MVSESAIHLGKPGLILWRGLPLALLEVQEHSDSASSATSGNEREKNDKIDIIAYVKSE